MLTLTLTLFALAAPAAADGLTWHDGDLASAVQRAAEHDTHVLVYFWRDGSEHCAALYQETLAKAAAAEAVGDMVCLGANYDNAAGAALFERFHVTTLPAMLFLDGAGRADDAILGVVDGDTFTHELARIRRGDGTRRGLEAALRKATPGSEAAIDACYGLAGKHLDLNDVAAHDACMVALREVHDPKALTLIGARAHLWAAQSAVDAQLAPCECAAEGGEAPCKHEASFAVADFAPLYAHAKRVKLPEARFEAWTSVADYEARANAIDKAVAAFSRAAKDVPTAKRMTWHRSVAGWAVGTDEHTPQQQRLALRFAEIAVEAAEALDPMSDLCHEACGEAPLRLVQAEALATLALAQDINGKGREAQKSAKLALERAGEHADTLRETLARLLRS